MPAQVLVEPDLEVVLVDRLREREAVGGEASAELLAVRQRELVEVGAHVRAHRHDHRASPGRGQDAAAGRLVGHDGRDRPAEALPQPLVAHEEERAVAAHRAAEGEPELVAAEVRLLHGVEVVAGVEGVVAVELVDAAVEGVGAGLRDDVDLPARAPPELGAVGVRLDAELAHGLRAEGGPGRAPRRAVREVVHERAVEEVHVRARVLAVDARGQAVGDHRPPLAIREGDDPGLQEGEVGVVAAVQGKVANRLRRDEVAELAGAGAHGRDLLGDGDLVLGPAQDEGQVEDHGLADHEPDAGPDEGAEPVEGRVHLVGPDGQRGEREVAGRRRRWWSARARSRRGGR